jgi:thiamine kinase-like enzyme
MAAARASGSPLCVVHSDAQPGNWMYGLRGGDVVDAGVGGKDVGSEGGEGGEGAPAQKQLFLIDYEYSGGCPRVCVCSFGAILRSCGCARMCEVVWEC